MLSKRRLQFFSRNGSALSARLSKFGVSTEDLANGPDSKAANEGGKSVGAVGLGVCSWWMYEVIK